jgi:putative phosphoesterase
MPAKPETITLGVVADTHVPDRIRKLPSGLLTAFKVAKVDMILHAGDACNWEVIRALAAVAPVKLVQGNRDWLLGMKTPRFEQFEINGVEIALAHGHRSIFHYAVDKWSSLLRGYDFQRYYRPLSKMFPDSRIIIFGHTHHQTAQWVKGQLFFNPGAAYPCKYNQFNPQYGIISITPDCKIRTEFHHHI